METRSKKGKTEKKTWDEQNRKDAIQILEKMWHLELEYTFYKIFHKLSKRGIHPILHHSNENVLKLEWKEENGHVFHLENHEIGEIKNLVQHVEHLKQERDRPFEEFEFRCHKITRKDCIKYRGLKISTRTDVSTKLPSELAELSGSSGRHSQKMTPIESCERSIKRDSSHFTNFKEEKY